MLKPCAFKNGNFRHTCRDVQLFNNGMSIQADCEIAETDGLDFNTSHLYLNDYVANYDGQLTCDVCWGFLHLPVR